MQRPWRGFGGLILRRCNLLRFVHKPARIDRRLDDKLLAELPGILRWAIEGEVL
jgi:phage/plasmid-associated DNA primase